MELGNSLTDAERELGVVIQVPADKALLIFKHLMEQAESVDEAAHWERQTEELMARLDDWSGAPPH